MWDTSPRIIRYPINFQICWCFSDLSPGSMLPSALHGTAPHHAVSELVAGLQGSPSKSWGEVLVFFFRPDVDESNSTTRKHESEISWDIMFLYVVICFLYMNLLSPYLTAWIIGWCPNLLRCSWGFLWQKELGGCEPRWDIGHVFGLADSPLTKAVLVIT